MRLSINLAVHVNLFKKFLSKPYFYSFLAAKATPV